MARKERVLKKGRLKKSPGYAAKSAYKHKQEMARAWTRHTKKPGYKKST